MNGTSLLALPPPDQCRGLRRVENSRDGCSRFKCIKCGDLSGGQWGQCKGICPVEQSPYYDEACLEQCLADPPIDRPKVPEEPDPLPF